MEVGQGPNWGCSVKEKETTQYNYIISTKVPGSSEKLFESFEHKLT
jgi:hypothetical protein